MQTVADFFLNPISGIGAIDETACAVPLYQVRGVKPLKLAMPRLLTAREVTNIPTPLHMLWCRDATVFVR